MSYLIKTKSTYRAHESLIVFEEFYSIFQINVIRLHLITFPTIEDLTKFLKLES